MPTPPELREAGRLLEDAITNYGRVLAEHGGTRNIPDGELDEVRENYRSATLTHWVTVAVWARVDEEGDVVDRIDNYWCDVDTPWQARGLLHASLTSSAWAEY